MFNQDIVRETSMSSTATGRNFDRPVVVDQGLSIAPPPPSYRPAPPRSSEQYANQTFEGGSKRIGLEESRRLQEGRLRATYRQTLSKASEHCSELQKLFWQLQYLHAELQDDNESSRFPSGQATRSCVSYQDEMAHSQARREQRGRKRVREEVDFGTAAHSLLHTSNSNLQESHPVIPAPPSWQHPTTLQQPRSTGPLHAFQDPHHLWARSPDGMGIIGPEKFDKVGQVHQESLGSHRPYPYSLDTRADSQHLDRQSMAAWQAMIRPTCPIRESDKSDVERDPKQHLSTGLQPLQPPKPRPNMTDRMAHPSTIETLGGNQISQSHGEKHSISPKVERAVLERTKEGYSRGPVDLARCEGGRVTKKQKCTISASQNGQKTIDIE